MRKMLSVILLAGVVLFATTTTALAAYDSDIGYVIVRCTVTIDVDVLDTQATAWFVDTSTQTATLGYNQADVSITSISVKNISNGAVLKYAVVVSTIERTQDGSTWVPDSDDLGSMIKGWYLSNDNTNVGECILAAVFAKERPATGDFETSEYNDQFLKVIQSYDATELGNHTYRKNGSNFDPAEENRRYASALDFGENNAISPVEDANNPRGLWFYIKTPQAVTDEYPRRFTITVYGTLIGSSW